MGMMLGNLHVISISLSTTVLGFAQWGSLGLANCKSRLHDLLYNGILGTATTLSLLKHTPVQRFKSYILGVVNSVSASIALGLIKLAVKE